MTRSGSNKRRRSCLLVTRFNEQEAAAIREMAEKRGQSLAALLRVTLLGIPLPPRSVHRPTVDMQALARLLAEMAKIRGEMGKIGSNLNQLTHYAHLDRYQTHSIALTLQEHEQCIRTLEELRRGCLQAMGFERERREDKNLTSLRNAFSSTSPAASSDREDFS